MNELKFELFEKETADRLILHLVISAGLSQLILAYHLIGSEDDTLIDRLFGQLKSITANEPDVINNLLEKVKMDAETRKYALEMIPGILDGYKKSILDAKTALKKHRKL